MSSRKGLLLILPLLSYVLTYSQDSLKPSIYVQIGGYSGFVWAHHRAMGYYFQEYPAGVDFRFGWKYNGSNQWQHALRFPEAGIGFLWGDFGNKTILGDGYALYGYFDIPILKKRRISWNYRLAAGLGYVTKIFDIQNNYNNETIGSHLNAFLLLSSGLKYQLTPRIFVTLDGGLHHYSNGNIKEPNQGLNTFYSMAGVQYFITSTQSSLTPIVFKPVPRWEIVFFASTGIKEERPVDNQKYVIFDTHTTLRRKFSHINGLGLGIDLMYDSSIEKQLKILRGLGYVVPDSIYNPPEWKNFSPAIHGSWLAYVGKLVFNVQIGVYLYNSLNRIIFNRWLLEIDVNKNMSIYGGLKSHLGSADYIQAGVVWKIKR